MKLKLQSIAVLVPLVAAALFSVGCGSVSASGSRQAGVTSGQSSGGSPGMMMGSSMHGGGMMMGSSMQRRRQAMMAGVPAAYRGLRNPLPASSQVLSAGEKLYQSQCAACHGKAGEGDGPAASGMSPPPANLRWIATRPMAGDGYLMWAVSEGGTAFGTAMPAFKDALAETDRWKIIRYLRTL